MEEADQLLISSAITPAVIAAVSFDLSPEVTIQWLLDNNHVYEISKAAIDIISSDDSSPKLNVGPLKGSIAAKHRICTGLANKIKDSGYTGDCGYNILLYPTTASTRSLLGFFARKLVSDEADDDAGAQPTTSAAKQTIAERVQDAISNAQQGAKASTAIARGAMPSTVTPQFEFIPRYHRARPFTSHPFSPPTQLAPDAVPSSKKLYGEYVVPTLLNCSRRAVALTTRRRKLLAYKAAAKARGDSPASIADMVSTAMSKTGPSTANVSLADMIRNVIDAEAKSGSRANNFNNASTYGQEPAVKKDNSKSTVAVVEDAEDAEEKKRREEERVGKERDAELTELRAKLEEILKVLREQTEHVENLGATQNVFETDFPAVKKAIEDLTKQYKMKKSMLDMLPDAENNMAKLLAIVEDATKRMMMLEAEWNKVREPLVEELERKKGSRDAAAAITKNKLMSIKKMRNEIAQMATEIREKEALAVSLKAEYEKMPKNINRTAYTYRIMDIIKQIGKQQTEIKKVVGDVKEVQKDINKTADTLARTEAVADEVLWQKGQQQDKKKRNAAQQQAAKESYKNLAKLRTTFDSLIVTVGQAGKCDTTVRDYETKTESLLQRVSGQSVQQTLNDLEEVKQENQQIAAKLKQAMKK